MPFCIYVLSSAVNNIRVILYFNQILGGKLVVLHMQLFMFGEVFSACLESVWRFERRTF